MGAANPQKAVSAPLMAACATGDIPTLSALLSAQQVSQQDKTCGADPGRSFGSTRYFYTLLPLEFAAYSSSESNVRLLLKHGAILRGTGALQLAAGYGKPNMVRVLVEAGADVNGMVEATTPLNARFSPTEQTALHYAAERGYKRVVQYLLDNGTDSSKLDTKGNTAMERARAMGHDGIVSLINSHEIGCLGT
ncbi:uncharacterized protein BP5553_00015 [Venustampulla echinocandica]|uniref:Uncharacterized protein n=1 Tax=Venustampulla echinocandica TaxID=2656787 RepID=A0A370TWX8_9HELO|nr:uncharacterized protein BP5553_00015 [Venustampulla echinocandica]RDL40036.1 hypothetical protein BP5553_00015 [Venustampulla echinocandica]